MVNQDTVVNGVSKLVVWWVEQRINKLKKLATGTMSINPYLIQFLTDYHGLKTPAEVASHLASYHLHMGHLTGFGKLIDEKIMPEVFGLQKLDKAFRTENGLLSARFDTIDHLEGKPGIKAALFSQKSSKWTIQLSQAKEMNQAFREIYETDDWVDSILVGITYGNDADLTDKYDIIRGINRGANHEVHDLTTFVQVKVGQDFWAHINDGIAETHEWVLQGFEVGVEKSRLSTRAGELLTQFKEAVEGIFADSLKENGEIDIPQFLMAVNSN